MIEMMIAIRDKAPVTASPIQAIFTALHAAFLAERAISVSSAFCLAWTAYASAATWAPIGG